MRAVLFRLASADSVLDALDGRFHHTYHLLIEVPDGHPLSLWCRAGLVGWYEHEDRSWSEVVMDYHVPSFHCVSPAGRKDSVPVLELDLPTEFYDQWLAHRQQNEVLAKELSRIIRSV
ncbi:MAG: hypothetical protein KF708_07940 [Pirellulales bacterium]|nr:hypothetical protein [Pirellulales bacterium]